jgi:hypothetical protein
MTSAQIRDIPPEIHKEMTEFAKERNMSLQEYLYETVIAKWRFEKQQKTIKKILDRPTPGIDSTIILKTLDEARNDH